MFTRKLVANIIKIRVVAKLLCLAKEVKIHFVAQTLNAKRVNISLFAQILGVANLHVLPFCIFLFIYLIIKICLRNSVKFLIIFVGWWGIWRNFTKFLSISLNKKFGDLLFISLFIHCNNNEIDSISSNSLFFKEEEICSNFIKFLICWLDNMENHKKTL